MLNLDLSRKAIKGPVWLMGLNVSQSRARSSNGERRDLSRFDLSTRETIRRLIRQGARRPGDEVGKTIASWAAMEAVINRIVQDPNILSELRHVLNTLSDRGEPLREFRDLLARAAEAREADARRLARPGEKIAAPFQAASLALIVGLIGFLLLERIAMDRAFPWLAGSGFLAIFSTWSRYRQSQLADQVEREAGKLAMMIEIVKEFEPSSP